MGKRSPSQVKDQGWLTSDVGEVGLKPCSSQPKNRLMEASTLRRRSGSTLRILGHGHQPQSPSRCPGCHQHCGRDRGLQWRVRSMSSKAPRPTQGSRGRGEKGLAVSLFPLCSEPGFHWGNNCVARMPRFLPSQPPVQPRAVPVCWGRGA